MLASTALVMFMTPGFAFFYGGLVRAKNVLGTVMQSFIALAIVSVTWSLIGYTLAFGPDKGQLIGGLKYLFLHHTGGNPIAAAPTIPSTVFMAFQLMFAIITPALITGAFAERMKFSGWLMLLTLWSIIVYSPLAHWVWGGGFLGVAHLGALDFAGGTVVHINAGVAALVCALYLGKRRGFGKEAFVPHNVPFVVLGASILWFGWFGFDDSLDVVGVHMVGGIVGALLTGVFASAAISGFSGSFAQVGKQAIAVLVTLVWSGLMTWVILKVTDRTVGLRVDEESEVNG